MANATKPKVMHVMSGFGHGGTEAAVLTLIKGGFYKDVDLHLVGLVRGADDYRNNFIEQLGQKRVVHLTDRKHISKRHMPSMIWQLHKEITRVKPDTLILSCPYSQFIGRIAAQDSPKIKVISFEHYASKWNKMWAAGLKITSGRTDTIFGDTSDSITVSQQYYRTPKPAFDVPLFIAHPGTPRAAESPDHFNILSLGRLEEQKNYGQLIKAASILVNEGRHFTLTIAGEGRQESMLKEMVSALHLDGHVRMPGWTKDRAPLDQASHIYVQPSLHEGLCLATVEAMTAGVPTVATDFGGTRDYGVDGVNMLKIKGYEASAIARTLGQLMDNYETLAPRLSKAAIATTEVRFGEQAVKDKWNVAAAELTNPKASSSQPARRPVAESHAHLSQQQPR